MSETEEIVNETRAYKENRTKAIVFMVTPTEHAVISGKMLLEQAKNRGVSMSSYCAGVVLKSCKVDDV